MYLPQRNRRRDRDKASAKEQNLGSHDSRRERRVEFVLVCHLTFLMRHYYLTWQFVLAKASHMCSSPRIDPALLLCAP